MIPLFLWFGRNNYVFWFQLKTNGNVVWEYIGVRFYNWNEVNWSALQGRCRGH